MLSEGQCCVIGRCCLQALGSSGACVLHMGDLFDMHQHNTGHNIFDKEREKSERIKRRKCFHLIQARLRILLSYLLHS